MYLMPPSVRTISLRSVQVFVLSISSSGGQLSVWSKSLISLTKKAFTLSSTELLTHLRKLGTTKPIFSRWRTIMWISAMFHRLSFIVTSSSKKRNGLLWLSHM